jgi:chemotaxis protein CheY-P-specific phosphatase CheC
MRWLRSAVCSDKALWQEGESTTGFNRGGVYVIYTVILPWQDDYITMSTQNHSVVFGTEDILRSLCNSVTKVLTAATQSKIHYSGMVQRITKTCLKPDIGCFVLFDGGFSGLVVINFSAASAMELYQSYMLSMSMAKEDLASAHTSDEVSNVMGELMNQIVGDFTSTVARELQTHITQSQPKMLALHKQVMLSVDTNLDQPESRRVTFFTGSNNIFYLELAIDRTEFIKLNDFETQQAPDPDELIAQANAKPASAPAAPPRPADLTEQDDFLKSLGM